MRAPVTGFRMQALPYVSQLTKRARDRLRTRANSVKHVCLSQFIH